MNKSPISEFYLGLFDGPHATPPPSDEGPIYLGIKNIREDGGLDLSDIRHIAEEDFPEWTKRVTPKPGDIVFTYEATLNRYAIIPQGFRGCLGRRLALIRTNASKVDNRYLFYYFFGKEWLDMLSQKIIYGSTVDRIPIIDFPKFLVNFPPLPIQRKIAAILSAYDDLIENNLRRIKILEEMAQNLYREWFVNFRFPGHEVVKMVNSPLGRIPEGWEVKKVKDIVKRLKPERVYDQNDVSPCGKTIIIDQSQGSYLGFHDNEPDFPATSDSPIIIFGDHTCKMQLMVKPFSIGPNVVPFIAANISLYYLYFLVHELVETKEYKRHWTELIGKEIVYSHSPLVKRFDKYIKTILEQIEVLTGKNFILRQTRDLLLPKLISGELDVSDLDIKVGEAE
jgi:type I restriction enzyme, S subunit